MVRARGGRPARAGSARRPAARACRLPRLGLALLGLLAAPALAAPGFGQAPPPHAQEGDADAGPSASDLALIFAVSIAVVAGIALYMSREAIARKKTAYDRGAYESQRDRDYEKYHSGWGDESAAGRGTGDLGGGGDGGVDDGDYDGFAPGGGGAAGRAADYYAVLGLGRDAAPEAIKRRYRELAKEAHPDRAGGGGGEGGGDAGRRMALINEAYDTLSDPERRRRYDLWLGRRGGGRP